MHVDVAPSAPIRVGPLEIRFHLDASQTDGRLTSFELVIPAGAKVPAAHSHEAFDEVIYGLSGVSRWTVGGRPIDVAPGQMVFIPRGTVHMFENRGSQPARMLNVITPGLLGPEYFVEIGGVVAGGGPPDPERIRAVMQRHGLRPAVTAT